MEVDDSAAGCGVLKKLLKSSSLFEKLSKKEENELDESSLEVKVEVSLAGGVEIPGVETRASGVEI